MTWALDLPPLWERPDIDRTADGGVNGDTSLDESSQLAHPSHSFGRQLPPIPTSKEADRRPVVVSKADQHIGTAFASQIDGNFDPTFWQFEEPEEARFDEVKLKEALVSTDASMLADSTDQEDRTNV